MRIPRDVQNWDPHLRITFDTIHRGQPLYSNLLRIEPYGDNAVEPDVAESHQVSADGKVWTFRIRQGIKWHDGRPLTVEDVVFSLKRLTFPTPTFKSHLSDLFSDVDTVEAADPSTVRVTLKRPSAVLLTALTSIFAVVVAQHVNDVGTTPVFSGPFKLEKVEPGVGNTLVRNPEYFFKGLPYLDSIVQFTIPDNATALAAFRTGRLDWTGGGTQISVANMEDLLRARPGAQALRLPGTSVKQIFLSTKEPFTTPDVRRALHLAVDRPEIVQVRYEGLGTPNVATMPPGRWALPPEEFDKAPGWRVPKDQDLVEARALMERAGFSARSPLRLTLMTQGSENQNEAVLIASQWRKINVDLSIDLVELPVLLERRKNATFEVHYAALGSAVDDPVAVFGRYFVPGAPENWVRYDLPEIVRLYEEQGRLLDVAARRAKVWELQRKAIELAWWIPTVTGISLEALAPRVKHFPTVQGVQPNRFRSEQVWLQQG